MDHIGDAYYNNYSLLDLLQIELTFIAVADHDKINCRVKQDGSFKKFYT